MSSKQNEHSAAIAFGKQAPVFDLLYGDDLLVQYKRTRVQQHMEQFMKADDRLLELNCGAGEDAVYFAGKGHWVHATDISMPMLLELKNKIDAWQIKSISTEQCSFTELRKLEDCGPYDYVYSNFGGLNCTDQLQKVIKDVHGLLEPNGTATFVVISKFSLWELLLIFKGKFKTAFRRFGARKGRKAKVEDVAFTCWYYSVRDVKKMCRSYFDVLAVEGLCTIVPPSYIEGFGENHPVLFERLKKWEGRWKASWPWRSIGDYFIITIRRK